MKAKTYKVTSTWSALPGCITTFHTSLKEAHKRAKAIKGHLFQHNPFAVVKDHADEFGEWERVAHRSEGGTVDPSSR